MKTHTHSNTRAHENAHTHASVRAPTHTQTFTTSASNSTSIGQCQCTAGYTKSSSGDDCVMCATGKYKVLASVSVVLRMFGRERVCEEGKVFTKHAYRVSRPALPPNSASYELKLRQALRNSQTCSCIACRSLGHLICRLVMRVKSHVQNAGMPRS